MTYYYYQIEGGNETWKPANTSNPQIIEKAMFCTILSLDAPLPDDADKETLAGVRYSGPLYFDLDDAESPASTAKYAKKLADRLFELDVLPNHIEIFASGGKGFHLTIPQAVFMPKPPKTGMTYLPAIYKEVAYKLAVDSMDFRVYTARKGRMFRRANIKRPNDLYKVQISYDELCSLAEMEDSASAEAAYKLMCSAPRELTPVDVTDIKPANGLMSEFDMAKSKITKNSKGRKKKPAVMPKDLPSFTALLDGRGIKPGTGFQQLAMQAAITAHARNMSREDFLSAAQGLCENHDSDGFRYNTASKRRVELGRMWDYTEDNPCYEFAPSAVTALLAHRAPDLKGIPASDADVEESIAEGESDGSDSEYGHANIYFTSEGAYGLTESGSKRLTSITFDNVTELVSTEDNKVSVVEADVYVGGRRVATGTSFELDAFNSVSGINKTFMRHGQSFSGSDAQARGVYMRMIQKARKANRRMYVSNREGLDIVKIPGHDSEIARKGFLIWSDNRGVAVPPQAAEEHVQMRFVGYPDPQGLFQTDIEDAPNLVEWLKTGENKEDMRKFLHNLLNCQSASHVGKLLGWSVAAYWRMLFHEKYDKFPLLHINGAAGQGKTETTKLFCNLHYYNSEPKMLTPTSTIFAITHSITGSCSIPIVLDEFKPSEMNPNLYDKFKLMLRDAYNCRTVERGGGTRENADYRSVHRSQLAAPIIFISEAAESESALMERVVLLTQIKPPTIQMSENLENFLAASERKELLGVLGKYIAASIIKRATLESFVEEFTPIYNSTRKELMLSKDDVDLSPEMLAKKSGAKERTVFNYAVVRFGLQKISNLIRGVYGEEFDTIFAEMNANVCSSVDDIQSQTVPEWLKVLNTFTDMAYTDPESQSFLIKGKDYAQITYAGVDCMEFNLRSCYHKYRQYQAASRSKSLFPGESAFIFAMSNTPALLARGRSVELDVPGGSFIFNLQELRANGYLAP